MPSKKEYKLSDASKKTKTEYGAVNTATSLIYNRFKQVMNLNWDRAKLQKLRFLLLNIVRSGPEENTGNRKLWDGNLKMLENFQLNAKATASNLFRNTIVLNLEKGAVFKLLIPKFNYVNTFAKAHSNTTFAQVKLFVFSFDLDSNTSTGKSMVLLRQKHNEDLKQDLSFDILLDNNCLTILVYKVSFFREPDDYESLDRQFIGATVLKAIYIKDGQEVVYIPQKIELPDENPEEIVGQWQNLS